MRGEAWVLPLVTGCPRLLQEAFVSLQAGTISVEIGNSCVATYHCHVQKRTVVQVLFKYSLRVHAWLGVKGAEVESDTVLSCTRRGKCFF